VLHRDIWGDGLGAGAMERNLGRWAEHGSDGEVYGTMGRVRERWGGNGAMGSARERWGGILGDGQGVEAMGRCVGRWAGCGSDGEVYGALNRAREL